jgi:hypothetical protein
MPTITGVPVYCCIASDCMAWRWWDRDMETTHDPKPEGLGWTRFSGTFGAPDYWARPAKGLGYCGLAGEILQP